MSWTRRSGNRLPKVKVGVIREISALNYVVGIWMCRGKNMNVMVMDVEGTDGRERGEDQVCKCAHVHKLHHTDNLLRTLNVNPPYSLWLPPKSSSSIYGSIKWAYTKGPTWAFSKQCSRSILVYSERKQQTGSYDQLLYAQSPASNAIY
jgi:hypothetical protein